MQTLFLTYRDGGEGIFTVPDDFGLEQLDKLLHDEDLLLTFEAGQDILVTLAILGADVRTAVLTSAGQISQAPSADELDRADIEHEIAIASEPPPDYQEALDKISDAYANTKAESQANPPERSHGIKSPTELELP